jgi:glycerol-3-phosphate dehydrogenase
LANPSRLTPLQGRRFDVVVVGGGATGAACARDAALRGLSVALVEHGDFASATSSASSKLLHGGLRYLQYLDFALVFEGLAERHRLMATAPHLCRATEFVFPVYEGERPSRLELAIGVNLYHALALGRPPSTHRGLGTVPLLEIAPGLRAPGLQGAQIYQDCQTDDARLVLENILDASTAGAVCVSYCNAIDLAKTAGGGLRGLVVQDRFSNETCTIEALTVVNATGPFSDDLLQRLHRRNKPRIRPTLGVHLVVDDARLPTGGRAFVLQTPNDHRLFFVLPDGDYTLIGTTDTDWPRTKPAALSPDSTICAEPEDVDYLLAAANHAFPSVRLQRADVRATVAGLRPLIADEAAGVSETSRTHELYDEGDGVLTIAGGKLTALRAMAEQTIDRLHDILLRRGFEGILRPCETRTRLFPGGGAENGVVLPSLPDPSPGHLRRRYGSRLSVLASVLREQPRLAATLADGVPDLQAEVVLAARHEFAQTPLDFLARRTQLAWHHPLLCAALIEPVANLMAEELHWDARQRARAIEFSVPDLARFRAGI